MDVHSPRLSDETIDPMENDAPEGHTVDYRMATDNRIDLMNVVQKKLTEPQRRVIEAYLGGYNHLDIGMTPDIWRKHKRAAMRILKEYLE